ncbi:MAG: precorrin-2 C(20)-methyltransferase [Desulfovibrio sp.]|nr:precorrin-2 C(20)-methyltransferase [Desulfovibrio sp.]
MFGRLYGVGVGPGAQDLLTLRALRVLQRVDGILAAHSARKDSSSALSTVRGLVPDRVEIIRLDFPMTRDEEKRQNAWAYAAQKTLSFLETGKSAAFVTIGDPLLYSTFGYLMQTVEAIAPDCPIEVIPGITSFQAAAARFKTVLAEDDESLLVLPGIRDEEELAEQLEGCDTAVILKTYRNTPAIYRALKKSKREDTCLMASLVEREGERLAERLSPESVPHYMSLVVSPNPGRKSKVAGSQKL